MLTNSLFLNTTNSPTTDLLLNHHGNHSGNHPALHLFSRIRFRRFVPQSVQLGGLRLCHLYSLHRVLLVPLLNQVCFLRIILELIPRINRQPVRLHNHLSRPVMFLLCSRAISLRMHRLFSRWVDHRQDHRPSQVVILASYQPHSPLKIDHLLNRWHGQPYSLPRCRLLSLLVSQIRNLLWCQVFNHKGSQRRIRPTFRLCLHQSNHLRSHLCNRLRYLPSRQTKPHRRSLQVSHHFALRSSQ